MGMDYIHGYTDREQQRLHEQSGILEDLFHDGTSYKAVEFVLEVGCGVGAQTEILMKRNPGVRLVSLDMSYHWTSIAKSTIDKLGGSNIFFINANVEELPLVSGSFDHVFICFLLEHLDDPLHVLIALKKLLRPGGSLTVIEGDHGTCFWTPQTPESAAVWQGLIKTQKDLGHDPFIGRRLFQLLDKAGFRTKYVKPCVAYGDGANPKTLGDLVNKIIVPMTNTAKGEAIQKLYTDQKTWEQGIADLKKTCYSNYGSFFYSWFKAVGVNNRI
ncbi:MAG TPA: methyltransferase domain-containing protein [Nitrospinota bacterium]|nr:methyltransferase domain-containing protein [Nitrospinota bacterium]|tara:strand:+ start:818 stop:1633 length:816 start_codon:yes stop_codon:yes gene_type:complete